MTGPLNHANLIDELDARQDEVLRDLDELNLRVEQLLNACLAERGAGSLDSTERPAEALPAQHQAAA